MPDFNFRNGNVTATAPIPPPAPAKTSAEPSSKPSSVKSPATTAAPKVNAGKSPPSFGSMKTSALSTKSQSRFAIVVLDVVLGSCRLDLGNPDSVIVPP